MDRKQNTRAYSRRVRSLIASIAFAVAAAPASAGAAENESRIIEEIVVTATYRETNLMDTPSGISAVSEELIKEMGAESMADVFQFIAGLNMTTEEVGASRYAVRGVSSQVGASQQKNTFSSIGVYFDNTPVTSALGPQGQTNGAVFDLNRVEVLKGPQGTLFGEGSQGGSIRYIFNQPDVGQFTAGVNVSAANMARSDDLSHRVDAVVNVPLIEDVLALRVLGFDTETAGFVDLIAPGSAEKDYNPNGTQGGRVALRYAPTDNFNVTASAYFSKGKSEGLPLVFEPYRARTPVYPGLETRSEDDVKIYDVTADLDLDWATLTSSTSVLDRDAGSTTGSPAATLGFLDSFLTFQLTNQIIAGNWPAVGPTGFPAFDGMNLVGGGFDLITKTERFIQEFRLVSPGDQRLRWTAGLFYKTSKDNINLAIPVIANPARAYLQEPFDLLFDSPTNKYENELTEIAAYGEVSFDITETVELTLGARVSRPDQKITPAGGENIFVATPTDDLKLTFEETWFAPKLVVAWRPTDGLMTYASYAKGFRPGNANTLFLFSIPTTELIRDTAIAMSDAATQADAERDIAFYKANFAYDGDDLDSFEIGAKWSSASRRLQVSAAAYRMDWNDMIMPAETPFVPAFTPGGTAGNPVVYQENVGKARSQGIEFELTALLTDALTLRLTGDLNDTEFLYDPVKGQSFSFAPEHSVSVMLDYELALTDRWSATLHLDHARVDKQTWSNGYGASVTALSNTNIPAYHISNARVTLRESGQIWRIVLFARNLTNEVNLMSGNGNGGGDPFVYSVPRTIGIEVGWQM